MTDDLLEEPAQTPRSTKTLKDVSRASGLSLITVSRALRKPETVSDATKAKVHAAIAEIGYVPNLTARSLVSQRSNIVGVVVPILGSSLFADFTQGLAGVLRDEGLNVLLSVSEWSQDHETDAAKVFLGRQADAIILTGFTHSSTCANLLQGFPGPIVETWNLRPEALDMAVGYDNYGAAAEMTRYLIGKGYERIAVVGGEFDRHDQSFDRYRGFMDTMREAGRSVPQEHQISIRDPATMETGQLAIRQLLALPNRPDAVFFHAEVPAHGAVLACMSDGLSMPEDVAIIGFGDLSLSALLPTPLTTVRIKAREIGQLSAKVVADRLNGLRSPQSTFDVGYQIMRRASA